MPRSDKELAVELTAAIIQHLDLAANEVTPEVMREILRTAYDAVRSLDAAG